MAGIKIISRPAGQAPEWVRDAWIGLELPLCEDYQPKDDEQMFGILNLEPVKELGGYAVSATIAFQQLFRVNPDACEWWRVNAPWAIAARLIFEKNACRLIS
jgi:hypothetical protein